MAEISNVKNALQTVVKKDRFLNAFFAGGKSLVVSLGRVLYAFWLQFTGLLYLSLTLTGVWDLYRHYRADHFIEPKRLWIEAPVTVILGFFTVHSFVKASRTIKKRK